MCSLTTLKRYQDLKLGLRRGYSEKILGHKFIVGYIYKVRYFWVRSPVFR